jgi:hypothetical protein
MSKCMSVVQFVHDLSFFLDSQDGPPYIEIQLKPHTTALEGEGS